MRQKYDGHWFDDGQMRLRLRLAGGDTHVDVYNLHFAGGSFGKSPEVVKKKSAQRRQEFIALRENVLARAGTGATAKSAVAAVVVCGDFNCDVDDSHKEMFPEAVESIERCGQDGHFAGFKFTDTTMALGVTESASKNLFRDHLKPGQNREVRYDRILCGVPGGGDDGAPCQLTISGARLIGTEQIPVDEVAAKLPPLFPSDHCGCFVELRI